MSTGIEAGRAQPQTTTEPGGGPFVRYSQPGRRPIYDVTSVAFGNSIQQPLVSLPGYVRTFRMRTIVTGGINNTTTTLTAAADAPYNIYSLVSLRDAFGTPLMTGAGYEMLKLVPMFSGGYGLGYTALPENMASWSSIPTNSTNTAVASFGFSVGLPVEFVKGYGVISMANASLLPTLLLNTNGTSTVWTAGTFSTAPVIENVVDADFYWLPEGINIAPPGLGSTRQWVLQQCNPTIATSSTTTAVVPRLGGFIDTLIFELKDSASPSARQDGWPARFRLYLDGVPIIDSRIDEIYDDIMNHWQLESTTARPTGVVAFTRKNSMSQIQLGLLDTLETTLSTNPGTLIQVEGAPWGSGGTSPYTLNVVAGQIIPSGTLLQGLPEV